MVISMLKNLSTVTLQIKVSIKMSLHDIPFINLLLSDEFLSNFHFIRPWWLIAFAALFLALYLIKKARIYQSPWQHFLPQHLTKVLLTRDKQDPSKINTTNAVKKKSQSALNINKPWLKPLIIGSIVIISLAGPAWEKLPQPVYQLERGSVLIMDMSYSMYSTDTKPNRLVRSRYKANDLLTEINEGEIGLIAYAGDAFIISPLTQDIKNIELLLPSLSPDIMPIMGANALAALMLAHETLKNSGHLHGDIYWFTDDIDNQEIADVYDWSAKFGHRLNILGVGTEAGAPIKLNSGELLKDNNGAIVVPKLPENKLSSLAKRGGGYYSTITSDDSDIKHITQHLRSDMKNNDLNNLSNNEQSTQGDQFKEQGPWLLLLALPFILSYFRRGTGLLSIGLLIPLGISIALSSLPAPVYANDSVSTLEKPEASLWSNLWKTKNQQAQQHFNKEDYTSAAQQFEHDQWQGSAHYKAGNYQQALDSFEQSDSANALYNQGNALAQMQQYDDAIERYKNALKKNPNLADAKDNLAKVEQAKADQEKQQQQQKSDKNSDDQQKQEEADKEKSDEQQNGDQQNNDQQNAEQQKSEEQSAQNKQQSDKQEQQEKDKNSSTEQSDENSENKKNDSQAEQDKKEQEKEQEQQTAKASDEENKDGEKTPAQIASDKKAQEAEQKHRKILNKVTDDPYLLLRNKMRLEYQKRRHDSNAQGVNKKW
jgi:Ca-activated chloride channel family protein